MRFSIETATELNVEDEELQDLLRCVYVQGGFTSEARASSIFDPAAVRSRGLLLCARDDATSALAGMVIVVSPGSPAAGMQGSDESELHLLGVRSEYRGQGLGRALVLAAVEAAKSMDSSRMVLWTQPTMHAAHRLYEATGFTRAPHRDFRSEEREFMVFEKRI